jgi:metal-responsive CopG/Arc/MetJ family transcriptional regulator
MKTIAITIDEPTLDAIDELAARGAEGRRGKATRPSRSEIIRRALQEFLLRRQRAERDERDRRILSKHRKRIAEQAEALVAEQGLP